MNKISAKVFFIFTLEHIISAEEISKQVKKKRVDKSIATAGHDFVFSDRTESFQRLADCIKNRYESWKDKVHDRNAHPLPFLADGPGSGKSRFLQELPKSFLSFVNTSEFYSKDFKKLMNSALFINISFGNGTSYLGLNEPEKCTIDHSVCIRILYSISTDPPSFFGFQNKELNFNDIMSKLSSQYSCIVLGIDEVNFVHEGNISKFKRLFSLVGEASCNFYPFFVPVLAGTVIGPITTVVHKKMVMVSIRAVYGYLLEIQFHPKV